MAYSVDLRKRIVEAVLERKMTIVGAAKTFGVGSATVERYLRRYRESKDLTAKTSPGRPSRLTENEGLLRQQLAHENDLRLEDRCKQWEQVTGERVSTATMSRWIKRVGVTRKKDVFCE